MTTDPICLCGHPGDEHQDYAGRCRGECYEPVKRWLWWCEDCAQDCQDKHRREAGHATEVVAVAERWDGLTQMIGQSKWPRW